MISPSTATSGPDIAFRKVSKVYGNAEGGFVALDKVDLTVSRHEFVAIVGPSGCGKTTLMRMAAGLDFPTSGDVLVRDRQVEGPGPDRAVVFQQFALMPWKTVRDNIGFGLKCRGAAPSEIKQVTDRYITMMRLQGHESAFPHQLSGGMQQRVAIARSYAVDPDVLLMDEPFGALDAQTRLVMQEELVQLSRVNPRTVVFITHSVEEAVFLADRIVVMGRNPGRIVEIIDVKSLRLSERWDELPIEEVMDLESFTHMRTRVWKLLKDTKRSTAA
ncbi:ABC transporter ATP-binding protein [Mangrovicella endophytica]|uniref:ABC transporter ATP-binding protein n=1 Tax=Mangrovicella endophytica TaxID=2066697 RepID=UPI000C9E63A1|nr:ABC transporter ATP-binding protein [Mangrovicella endophytica]